MATRVFQLAKELNVKSTSIVEKCQAEGLDVKNHMSTVSAGLEATIREWFSEGEHSTTVESTERVDLSKVTTKKTRSRKKKEDSAGEEEPPQEEMIAVSVEPAEATAAEPEVAPVSQPQPETPDEHLAAKAKKEPVHKRKSPKEIAAAEAGAEVVAETEEQVPAGLSAETPEEVPTPPDPEVAETKESVEVSRVIRTISISKPTAAPPPKPFVPKPATLQGPQVIRVERADILPRPPSPKMHRSVGPKLDLNKEVPPSIGTASESKTKKSRRRHIDDQETDAAKQARLRAPKRRGRRGVADIVEEPVAGASHEWRDRDLLERQERLAQASGTKLRGKERKMATEDKGAAGAGSFMAPSRRIEQAAIKEPITIKDLSSVIGIRANEILARMMTSGQLVTINQIIPAETAEMLALEFGVELKVETKSSLLEAVIKEYEKEVPAEELSPRPPVVAFLGHVDHGKTSLLDRIRRTSVVSGEAGGITQHIGSYLYDDGQRRVTFLDTPGHKAFTEMRARGANMTDIAVLVVAADDGVMPQTEEAINHVKAAGVPIVVALNKIDLPNTDENKILGQLADKGLIATKWGGDTEVVRTSATTGEGINELIEYLDYIAELRQLKARNKGPATGWIIESEMATGEGVLARLLIKSGTLQKGDIIVSGASYGKIRKIVLAGGKAVKEAGPATPVGVAGLNEIPMAGDPFFVIEDISKAKEIAEEQRVQKREKLLAQHRQVTLENLFSEIKAGELKELNVIIKADVQGSVDVLSKSIMEMNTAEVAVRILHAAVGGISESDVLLAEASNAIIIGFQVIADERARSLAETRKVEIRLYRIIYQIIDDIKKALEGMLTPHVQEKQLGRAEVRQIFRISRYGAIAGCFVTEGTIPRSAKVRLIRDNIVIRDNNAIESIRRNKDDASEVRNGFECGIKLQGYDDIKEGDLIEAFEFVEISRTLDSVSSR